MQCISRNNGLFGRNIPENIGHHAYNDDDHGDENDHINYYDNDHDNDLELIHPSQVRTARVRSGWEIQDGHRPTGIISFVLKGMMMTMFIIII